MINNYHQHHHENYKLIKNSLKFPHLKEHQHIYKEDKTIRLKTE